MLTGRKGTSLLAVVAAAALGLSALTASPSAQADPAQPDPAPVTTVIDGSAPAMTVDEARDQLDELEAQSRDLAAQKATAQEKMTVAQNQLTTTQDQIALQQAQMDRLRDQISRIALQRYQDRGLNTTAVLMTSSSSEDLLGYITAMQQVTDTAETLFSALQLNEGTLADLRRSEQGAIETIAQEQADLEAAAEGLEAKVAAVSSLLNRMTALSVTRAGSLSGDAMARGLADPSLAVPDPSASLVTPMDSYRLSSPFGMRVHPITGAYSFHDGVDLASACGAPIRAAAQGLVVDYYWSGGYGNRLVVDNGLIDGHHIVTSYNHLSSAQVGAGDVVDQGQVIAKEGSTGDSTGCHLHFMVWSDGQTMDPADYISV